MATFTDWQKQQAAFASILSSTSSLKAAQNSFKSQNFSSTLQAQSRLASAAWSHIPTALDSLNQSRIIAAAKNNVSAAAYAMPSMAARQSIMTSNLTTFHALDISSIHKQSLLNSAIKSVNLQKYSVASTNNILNLQIQHVTANNFQLGAQFNNRINMLGLKNVEKTSIEIQNLTQLFGAETIDKVLQSINESSSKVIPSESIKEFTEPQKQNAEVSEIDETSYTHEGKNGEPTDSVVNKILQQYHSLSKMQLVVFTALLGELFSAMWNSLVSNVGLPNAIIMVLILTAPYTTNKHV